MDNTNITNNMLSVPEKKQDQSLTGSGIGVVRVSKRRLLEEVPDLLLEQAAGGSGSFDKDAYKARNTVNAYSETFTTQLLKGLNQIPYSNMSMDNSLFRKYVSGDEAFLLLRKMLYETSLRESKGGTITFKAVIGDVPNIDNEEALKLVRIRADYLCNKKGMDHCIGEETEESEEKTVICLYSNGELYGFASVDTAVVPIKGLEKSGILYDWKWNSLNNEEKKRFTAWLDQLAGSNASENLVKLIHAIKVSVNAENIIDTDKIRFDEKIIVKGTESVKVPDEYISIKGLFREAKTGCDLKTIQTTDILGCIPCTTSICKPCDLNPIESRCLKNTPLKLCVPTIDQEDTEEYECLIPLTKNGFRSMRDQGLVLTGGSAIYFNDGIKIVLNLMHKETGIDYSIEKRYVASHIRWLTAFPHVFVKNRFLNYQHGKIQTEVFFYHVPDDPCSPDFDTVNMINSDTTISIMCEPDECMRIPEMYYRPNKIERYYERYCLRELPEQLSFFYMETGIEKEVGALLTGNKNGKSFERAKETVLGFDLGTAYTTAAVKDESTGEINMIDFIRCNYFSSITSIPEKQAAMIEKFYRLSCGYDEKVKTKIRTALMGYPEGAGGSAGIHREGTFINLCSETMNLLESEKNPSEPSEHSYLKTDIKFGAERASDILNFLREVTFPIIAEQISNGFNIIEINVSYPNEELRYVVDTAWSSLIAEMRTWPMVSLNKVEIKPHILWTEAVAVANYILNSPNVLAASHIGFVSIDVGDGTSDISMFTPSKDGSRFQYENQMSLKYAGDDILIDTIIHMYAGNKNTSDRYEEIYGQGKDAAFRDIWHSDNSKTFDIQVKRCEELLNRVDAKTELYRDAEDHEILRNEILTMIEDYGFDINHLLPKTKALLILRFSVLFYTVACYMESAFTEKQMNGILPVYIYGGGAKALKLLTQEGKIFGNSPVGIFFRNMIANKIGYNPDQIEIIIKEGENKDEVARGMVMKKNTLLSGKTLEDHIYNKKDEILWDDEEESESETPLNSETEKPGCQFTVSDEIRKINGEMNKPKDSMFRDFIRTLYDANRNAHCSDVLLGLHESAWIYTILQSTGHNKHINSKEKNDTCYVSQTENNRILSSLHATRERRFGNVNHIDQEIKLRYHAARMVDQYLVKMCSKSCKE